MGLHQLRIPCPTSYRAVVTLAESVAIDCPYVRLVAQQSKWRRGESNPRLTQLSMYPNYSHLLVFPSSLGLNGITRLTIPPENLIRRLKLSKAYWVATLGLYGCSHRMNSYRSGRDQSSVRKERLNLGHTTVELSVNNLVDVSIYVLIEFLQGHSINLGLRLSLHMFAIETFASP